MIRRALPLLLAVSVLSGSHVLHASKDDCADMTRQAKLITDYTENVIAFVAVTSSVVMSGAHIYNDDTSSRFGKVAWASVAPPLVGYVTYLASVVTSPFIKAAAIHSTSLALQFKCMVEEKLGVKS